MALLGTVRLLAGWVVPVLEPDFLEESACWLAGWFRCSSPDLVG